jgi:cellulose synthase/poly-beta-1,6-N-acetylglucosamine synthase-like glycosyltransferase
VGADGVAAAQALSLILGAAFFAYWVLILVSFLRRVPTPHGNPTLFDWHFFVPCRDEAAVIGQTIAYLRGTFPSCTVWVIDDDSEDDTATIVASWVANDPYVRLIQRRRPDARTGKGEALNSAYRELRSSIAGHDAPDRVIVCVVDADGRPSANCLSAVSGPLHFGNPRIVGVQVEVRIINTNDPEPLPGRGRWVNFGARSLVRVQDLEFRTVIGAIQASRGRTRSVGLGGNGQFTRFSALAELDDGDGRAWRGSLIEDFELGLQLQLAGGVTAYCPSAWVEQEGIPSLHRFLTQRTRWGQGVMQCMKYLPSGWNSPRLTTAGAMEISYFLIQPWITLLGSIIFPVPLIALVVHQVAGGHSLGQFLADGGWELAGMYLLLGSAPFWFWGPLYRRQCAPEASRLAGLGWGVAYLLYIYLYYVTLWRAAIRLARGHNGWSKTRRNAEFQLELAPLPSTTGPGT